MHAAVSFLKVFSLTKDILTGRSSSKVNETVNRLIGVMRDHERLSSMALGYFSHRAEKSQFWYTVTHVILPLAGQCAINKDLGSKVNRLSPVDHTVPRPKQCYLGEFQYLPWKP